MIEKRMIADEAGRLLDGGCRLFAGMMSKVTDLSKNLYLLVTDLQKNLTFVPEKTAEFLGMEAGYSVDFIRS